MEDFIQKTAQELGLEYEPVETYLKRGFSGSKSCDEICKAIQNAYKCFISDEKVRIEVKEQAKKVQESIGTILFESIGYCEETIMQIESNKPFFTEDYRKSLTINLFMSGVWPENGEVLTREELDWLRESLLQFPPKGVKI